jgi:predicted ABC-type ATPase
MGQIILSKVKPEHQRKDNPTTYFVGGTVGVGKSTVISHLQDIGVMPKSDEAAEIDPDFLKAGLPGYNDGAGAANVHRQSRIVADRVMQDATSAGMDVIIVGTGKRDEHAIGQKRAGHKVVGHFVYAPVQTAEKRLRDRNQAGGRQIRDIKANALGT